MFSSIDIHSGSQQINPAATTAIQNYYGRQRSNERLMRLFMRLKKEAEEDKQIDILRDEIERYQTQLPGTKGLEEKLTDGGFCRSDIEEALLDKQYFFKKATKYQYYESAQLINSFLYAKVKNLFNIHIKPMIERSAPLAAIQATVYERVIRPVMQEIEAEGADDTCLCYTEDDIFGILYYLTGNCHINWTNYDELMNDYF